MKVPDGIYGPFNKMAAKLFIYKAIGKPVKSDFQTTNNFIRIQDGDWGYANNIKFYKKNFPELPIFINFSLYYKVCI